jgi:hypothetical protein
LDGAQPGASRGDVSVRSCGRPILRASWMLAWSIPAWARSQSSGG